MTVLPMRYFGDPVLFSAADEISEAEIGNAGLRSLVADMVETMNHYGGVGLAANQVGITRRVFVFDCEGDQGHVINPTWVPVGEDTQVGSEGCLSIPGIRGDVTRAQRVRMRGTTVDGEAIDRIVEGLLARCVQHETDHLDGVLFLRHLSRDQRKTAMQQIRSSEWFNR